MGRQEGERRTHPALTFGRRMVEQGSSGRWKVELPTYPKYSGYEPNVFYPENNDVLESSTLRLVEGVPLLRQERSNWCGYTSLAMVLQFYGYRHLTPKAIYRHIHKADPRPKGYVQDYYSDPTSDFFSNGVDEVLHPTLQHLASVAEELSNGELKADILDETTFNSLNEKRRMQGKTSVSPMDVLDKYIKEGVPCIVRTPNHNIVIVGFDPEHETYIAHNPLTERSIVYSKSTLDKKWGHKEENIREGHPGNTNYLMLVLRRR